MSGNEKKRIALVVNTLSGGGAERAVSNLSKYLSELYDIDIILNDDEHIDYPYSGNIISLKMPLNIGRMSVVYQLLAVTKRTIILRYLKKNRNYTAVISFSEMTNFSNVLSGNKNTKTIVSVRNDVRKRNGKNCKQKLVLSVVIPYVCRKANRVVSCSKEIANELIENYGLSEEKSFVIYNGLELQTVRKKASELLSQSEEMKLTGKKLIVSVGRLTAQKGQWHLLKVVKYLRNSGLSVHLILLGEGELRPALEQEIRSFGLTECVSMPGFVDNPYKYMARADVVVISSLYEGFSNVILEALACDVPVVSTDHKTGAREILLPDTDYRTKVLDRIDEVTYGMLVPVCEGSINETSEVLSDEEAIMAEAIQRVLTNEDLAKYYKQASQIRAEQNDIKSVCLQWIRLIEAG